MLVVLRARISSAVLLFFICVTVAVGCGGSKRPTGPLPDTVPPVVTATIPARGASDVALNTSLTATFSESMDAATVNAATFTVKDTGNNPVGGTVTCVAATATFTPSVGFDGATAYVATLSTGVSDLAGNHVAQAYSWGFTTVTCPALVTPNPGEVLDNGCSDGSNPVHWAFDWTDCPGATAYHLYVKNHSASIAVIDVNTLVSSDYTFDRLGGYIVDRNRLDWRWKVQAFVNGQWGEWTAERSFDVEPLNTDCPPTPVKR